MIHLHSEPLKKPFFTPGTFVLMIFMGIGFAFGISRLFTGLESVTNLNDSYPWGIWIAIDVACGVALAAGGFTTAALVDIFGGKKYHALLRPAVLTAWLGYIMVAIGLMFDLGRYWNIWQPMFNWQGNSVMFELAMCVMAYLIVLSFEMAPAILEGLKERIKTNDWGSKVLAKFEKPIIKIHALIKIILPIFIVAGVVLSCMHQSSLGTLMVIAPTKLNALWYSAWLPLFFLISAIMVGFPMVVIEAMSSSKSFKRESEIEILGPLAAKIPWFIGIYFLFRMADFLMRIDQINFWKHPADTVSFFIEIIIGLIIPFVLLSIRSMRRSRGWLLTACGLIVFGVALNRINVFLIGYHPRFAKQVYFPSIGEIFLTIGLVCFLIFLYRFFVNYFPILPQVKDTPGMAEHDDDVVLDSVQPVTAWIVRGSAVVFLLLFIVLYVTVHKQAIAESTLSYGEVFAVKKTETVNGKHASPSHAFRPEKYRNFYFLNSPILNEKADYYEAVRFSHRSHDNYVGGDCSICHHRVSEDKNDRIGMDIKVMHAEIEVRIGGACVRCHEDLNDKEFQKCGECHIASNEADFPARIGLKGAYHRQCIGCHAREPVFEGQSDDCISCHHPITPAHKELLTVSDSSSPQQLTVQCLNCHPRVGEDIIASAHWNWKGLTPDIQGHEHSVSTGLLKVVDNYTISMRPDLVESRGFHIGYSPGESTIDFNNPENIDCLVCHDTTGTYKKDASLGGMPAAGVKLAPIVAGVGRPSRQNCGSCHFYVGGGANVKHGDLEPVMVDPPAEIDVHMGVPDMICQDCHQGKNHKIPGMSFMAPVTEGRVHCETCHSNQPHGITGFLSKHLDDHVRAVSCEACHIPSFAKETPTRLSTDFSTAGLDNPVKNDELGMPGYNKKIGSLTWGKDVVPTYRWFDGTRKTYVLGDRMESMELVELNEPLGEKHIPSSRIFPFKVHTAVQPYDKENKILAAVKFKNGFNVHYDWSRAIKEGMEAVGLKYSGKYGFVKTRKYTSIHHQVVPAKMALGCTDCHQVEAISCKRCHKKAEGMDQPSHTRMVYPHMKNRIDFKALGYEDDPAIIGGRFYIKMGRGRPPK